MPKASSSSMPRKANSLLATLLDGAQQPAMLAILLVLVSTCLVILLLLYRRLRPRGDTILFTGLAGSGKTTVFTKLINPENQWVAYTSVTENIFTRFLPTADGAEKKQPLKLLDYPGSDTFRKALFQRWLNQERKTLKGVVFTVDSASFNKKDVAELLYDILFELKAAGRNMPPLLVVCNKQDIGHAKSGELIQRSLEQEFGLINLSREAALSSTDGRAEKRLLADTGREFKWEDLPKTCRPDFVECSAQAEGRSQAEFTLGPLRRWIAAI